MATKLTLNIDEKIIKRAKRKASKDKVSLSKMVERYLDVVSREGDAAVIDISPEIEWLAASGTGKPATVDGYWKKVAQKHGFKI